MSGIDQRNCDSVDLTEDEESCEEVESPFHFVDCSQSLKDESLATLRRIIPSSHLSSNTPSSSHLLQNTLPRPSPSKLSDVQKLFTKNTSPIVATAKTPANKKVTNFTSVQIRPPNRVMPQSQIIETVTLDSDNESEAAVPLPRPLKLQTRPRIPERPSGNTKLLASPNQLPGKVVIIKKNNKYYKIIIPHNVMPNIDKPMGPVLINIPEVGPLVISNDPQATKAKSSGSVTQELSLNLDAIDETQKDKIQEARFKMQEAVLNDKKFCWCFSRGKGKKRDLDGFATYDRCGFHKVEAQRARKCERIMCSILTKCRMKLIKKTQEYERFKKSLLKKNRVKLVKIHSIIQNSNKIKKKKEAVKIASPKQLVETVLTEETPKEVDDFGADLLVTKKVVILNKENEEIRVRQSFLNQKRIKQSSRKGKVGRPRKKKRNNNRLKLKQCVVQIPRSKQVEEAYKKFCKKPPPKLKNGITQDTPTIRETSVNLKKTPPLTPLPYLSNIKMILMSRIIECQRKLAMEMNRTKPILILTEQSLNMKKALEYYSIEFTKANLVYIVNANKHFSKPVLWNEGFVSAVELGYVKVVTSALFCDYITNDVNFPRLNNHETEHNYCSSKNI